jgi:hypothetical protein
LNKYMMLKRWLVGLFLGAIVFVVVWFGDPSFSIFVAVVGILASSVL